MPLRSVRARTVRHALRPPVFWTIVLGMIFAWPLVVLGEEALGTPAKPRPVDFDREIRPILSETCFRCHGPDAKARKAELRLDQEAEAKAERRGGTPLVPGDRDTSAIWERITATEPELMMPPPGMGKPLTPAQIELFGRWIDEGGTWAKHWAFVPPQAPPLPAVKNASWARNSIDTFILARLEAAGVEPAPEADKETLIRRLSFDLHGLPPTPAEVDAFLADTAPEAYERLVDRLLASPRFGERMATGWLDLARYADTNGYQVDNERFMWRWREWVIESYNDNLPFDQFTIQQIAGDLLTNATLEQKIATGFNRNHPTTFEGGVIPEEYRMEYVIDRVNTMGTAWLGMTFGCARCHDHKYDPLTQREFYQLFAYFNNVPERGLDGDKGNSVPELRAPTRAQQADLDRLTVAQAEIRAKLTAPRPELDQLQIAWEETARETLSLRWRALQPATVRSSENTPLTVLDDRSVLAGGPNPNRDTYEVTARTPLSRITGIRLEALKHDSLPGAGAGRHPNSNFVLAEVELEAVSITDLTKKQTVVFVEAYADYSQANYEIAKVIDGQVTAASGWAVDGPSKREDRVAWLLPKEPFGFEGGTELHFRLKNEFPQAAVGRFRLSVSMEEKPYQPMMPADATNLSVDVATILATEPGDRTAAERERLLFYYRRHVWPEGQAIGKELDEVEKSRITVDGQISATMIMEEMPQPRPAFMLIRGQYDHPGEQVQPGVPGFLHALPQDGTTNRLALARWLVDPANPLTARVAVNRFWQHYFEKGLVKTAEDFGVQGERPSHPELLDWLAVEFQKSWDIKALQKLIVTSATYRQSSRLTPEQQQRDPENRLLARGPRLRLPAELIRDNALAVSGLLVEKIGGRSVKTYQPPGLWEEISVGGGSYTAQIFEQATGPDLYRRSLYTFWKRALPPPSLQTFDAPTREYCVVNRSRTNTPLQALVLLNDPTYVEAARAMASRVGKEGGSTPEDRAVYAFRLATARRPLPAEQAVLLQMYQARKKEFEADPAGTKEFLSVGDTDPPAEADLPDLAAWTTVCSVLLNLDETVTKE